MPGDDASSSLEAEAWAAAADRRQGIGLSPAEVADLWAAAQRKRADGDAKRLKSGNADAYRVGRAAGWAPAGTTFDDSLDVEAIRQWKANIIAAASRGDTTEGEGKKAVFALSTLLQWASESRRFVWSLPQADDDGLTWRDALRLPRGYGRGMSPRPFWGSELAAILGACRGKWIEAAALLALNTGATQADFGIIRGGDVEELNGRWFLAYGRAKVAGRGGVRAVYPLWSETVEALREAGAWGRVGADDLLMRLPGGEVVNKDNANHRHWGPIRKRLEASGALRKPRRQGDNGFRNLRRTGASQVYVAAPTRERAELGKAYLQQELIGGSASAYIIGHDSPMVAAVEKAGEAMRAAGVFGGDAEAVGDWGRGGISADLTALLSGDGV
jgi:hypothetical protein